MNSVSRTAFYCTGVRALDARSTRPVCDDRYAERFLDDEAWRTFEPFRGLRGANITNRTRHRIIDDLLRERLAANPDLRVVLIGAGFDSRAFRLPGGRWIEVDEPQILAWKEPRLPTADSPNPLTRIPIDFAADRLVERLAPFATDEPVVIVIEGVLFYLDEPTIRGTLEALQATFPRGEILCDIMTPEFFRRYSQAIHRTLLQLGASLRPSERPVDAVCADAGYRQTLQISITRKAAALGQMPWFMRILLHVSRRFVDGYTIRAFAPPSPASPD